ncbi:hypothetical protein E3T26_00925 [Cryobacterium sp. TMT1-21]|uniref:Uncharacterized protein n=1 Tax=Cryobacterium shii TaxID=1259235 RepID=A0AAQ2HEX3_9MICO|nr:MULTISPECIES: hypothetical protein [Cryobacterium]TFC44340.1 hypothetical protein E3O49_11860 [Cryobacterium shii]TFD17890.1 hypothetical protein E3T26_00925 [Cryobacterium sp. TMT1-21]TFD18010.1 hypothetical protein E3T32_13050 [Cryobacterium sp. TMT2-23]TFD20916.1 hypothetical protein E3T42_01080 [Cryobacterium sp. TMT4-10]TFD35809.1 hypothetical protein E3T37_14960 [Cryobacterium sp. TMT2-10]
MTTDDHGVSGVHAIVAEAGPAPDPVAASAGASAPAPASARAFSTRELRIGGAALGLGAVVGVIASLLVASVAGSIGSLVAANPMADAAAACDVEGGLWITVGDEGRSITMDGEGEESVGADYADMACILNELGTPDSVISRIDTTRALDGRQTGTWDGYSASWGYHPDNGLDIVIDVTK